VVASAVIVLAAAPAALAQTAPAPGPLAALESLKLSLDQLELTAGRDDLSVRALADLQRQVAPLGAALGDRRAEIEPQLARVDRRLKELGPAPAKDAAPEQPAVAAERDQLTRQFRELDAASKMAKLLDVRVEQLTERVNERRSALFTQRLFQRASSIFDPFLWIEAGKAIPDELGGAGFLLRAWWSFAGDHGGYGRMVVAVATLTLVAAVMLTAAARWRRRPRTETYETRFARAWAGLAAIVEAGIALPLGIAVLILTLRAYDLLPDRIAGIGHGLLIAAVIAGIGQGIGRGVLAPDQPQRRLPAVDDVTARQLAWHLGWGARALGATIFLNVVYREVVTQVALTLATNALFALAVDVLLLHLLWRLRGNADDQDGPAQSAPARWLRGAAWVVAGVVAVALAFGYIGAATFAAERLLAAVAVFAVLYLLLVLIDALFAEVLSIGSPRARAVAANLGLTPRGLELVGTLLSALTRLVLIVIAVLLPFASRGSFATEVFGAAQGTVFGLSIGHLSISITAILSAAAVLAIGLVATRAAQRWLEVQFLPRTALDPGLQHSVSTILGYVGVIAAVTLALAEFGIDLQKVALVAGALSVGIGFGLQSIVSNFVSGLILLAERPIRVGDSIVVKGEEGYVRRISVRATEIETFERASVIIPNSELISGVVKNWTHGNTNGRIMVKVGVAYDADPDAVRDILMACACDHPQVLQMPVPRVFLASFGDSALNFELRCFVANVDYGLIVRSDLHFAILHRLRQARIAIPYPQREVRLLRDPADAAVQTQDAGAADPHGI
jgi:small-conductance mechanosensitive channel